MDGLLPEFWPLTMTLGFIDAPFPRVRETCATWLQAVRHAAPPMNLEPSKLTTKLRHLEPLSFSWTRMLLQETRSSWTAMFLNNNRGADAVPPVAHLCGVLKVKGLVLSWIPQQEGPNGRVTSYGQVRFDLLSASPGFFLNHERTVYVMNDGGRWAFTAQGAPQPFEELAVYKARRVRDRFTPDMLKRYACSLGVFMDDPDFYTGEGALLKTGDPLPPGQRPMSLSEARRELGLPN